jgi:hypothetical protein
VNTGEAFIGGVTAVFGPEMVLVFFALFCGAVVAGSRHAGVVRHLILALVFVVAVGAVWVRADLVPPARFSHWLAVVPLLGLAEIRRIRMEWEDWMSPAIALCTAGLVLFWRADRFGPVLATLRGDWQEPLALAPRWAYHLGTALALGAGLMILGLLVSRLPARVKSIGVWVVLAVAMLMAIFDLAAPAQHWLLLHGPPIRVG